MKRFCIGLITILLGVFLLVSFASATAMPPGTPPSPTAYYYGDADGDTLLTTFDLSVMNNLFNGQVYNYGTLQPDNPNDDWNTSDIDSDDLLTTFDLGYYSQHFNGQPLDLLDKPWIIEGVNLHASYATTGVFFPFNANVSAYNGDRGRAGVAVVAEILPIGSGSTTTGSLSGRDCAAVDLFDLANPGAQCALAVTVTDWQTNLILGLTENGTYGLQARGDAAGTIAIQLSVSDNGLGIEVPNISTTVFIHFIAANLPPVISNLPTTKESRITKTSSFKVNATDPDIPPGSLTYSITGENCSFTPTINSTSGLLEWTCGATPETCDVDVRVTDAGTPPPALSDTKTLTIKCNNNPTLIGGYVTASSASSISVSGNYAYVADLTNGLYIFDISNPASPTLLGQYDTPSSTFGIYSDGHYAYLTDYTWGLYIIDVSNPASPSLVGTCATPGNPVAVYAEGNLAYVADKASGLQVINISNPAAPVLWGNYDTPGEARNVYVRDGYAYVADTLSGLQIINVSNPAWPTFSGSYITSGQAYGVYVKGNYAYMASYDFEIIDVSDPAYPVLAGRYYPPDAARSVYVDGAFAYVAASNGGLDIVDISNPASPTNAGNYNNGVSSVFDVEVIGNYAYVAYGMSGLQIIQVLYP